MPRDIKTNRLLLRGYREDDAHRIAQYIAVPEVQRWLPLVPHPYDLTEAGSFIARAAGDEWKLAITLEGQLIGGIAISEQFGYWLAEPFWGKGYATEASRAILGRHFDQSDANIMSGHRIGNDRSRKVLLKLGFQDTDTRSVHSRFEGADVTLQDMELSADNWRLCA